MLKSAGCVVLTVVSVLWPLWWLALFAFGRIATVRGLERDIRRRMRVGAPSGEIEQLLTRWRRYRPAVHRDADNIRLSINTPTLVPILPVQRHINVRFRLDTQGQVAGWTITTFVDGP